MFLVEGGLDDERVQALLAHHTRTARAQTAPGSAHALDLGALRSPEIRFWSAWQGEAVIATGALRRLPAAHGEVKSMHTAQASRGRGVGGAMLRHIIASARAMGMTRLNLETGSWPFFEPARALYRRHGFVACGPFGDYAEDPNSTFMTRPLDGTEPAGEDAGAFDRGTRLERLLRASPAVVYRALLDPAAIRAWKVPTGMTAQVHALDAREGGRFRVSLTYIDASRAGKSGPRTDTYGGRFVHLEPERCVVEALAFETDDPSMRGEMTIRYTLRPHPQGTVLAVVHERVPSGIAPVDNALGWSIAIERLSRLVEAGG